MDHQPPRKALGDVRGREAERISEYFDFKQWPDKADKKVTRQEFLAILTRQHMIQQETRWHRRLWRWLSAPRGSKPVPIGDRAQSAAEGKAS